jgi:TnpA family transposase
MGFKFAPRISSSLDRNLYTYQPVSDQGPLNELIAPPVRAKYIIEHWEEMQRVASSLRHGSVSASLLMRRLRAYSRQNRLASALTELGKLERTSFLLDYFQDEALRRRILIGLNKGEALHALARQLFSGKHGELWDRAFEDQMYRASCLHLIMAAIATWNAVYLSQAVEELKKRGEVVASRVSSSYHTGFDGNISISSANTVLAINRPVPSTIFDHCGFQNRKIKRHRRKLKKIVASPLIPKRV